MSTAFEKTAKEHVVLSGLESYIEDVIEYSDTIADIHNDVYDNKQSIEDNHTYAMEHINDEYHRLHSDMVDEIDSLQNQIDELKQQIEELQK